MKAVIGQFYKDCEEALKQAEKLKRKWKGKMCFVVVGNKNKGFIVISETTARSCGIKVPLQARRYNN